jgi:DNA-binding IclR family transcriptional regulator
MQSANNSQRKTMSTIDEILWLLKDGEWHELTELAEKAEIPKVKAEMVVSFLGEYDFIQINEDLKRLKLKPSILEFFNEIQRFEKEDEL